MIPFILSIINGIICLITFIGDKEKRKSFINGVKHICTSFSNLIKVIDNSKRVTHFYHTMILLFIPIGFVYSYLLGRMIEVKSGAVSGIYAFLVMALVVLFFAYTSYLIKPLKTTTKNP